MPTSKFQKKLYRFLFYLFWVILVGIVWGELKPVAEAVGHSFWDCTLNFSAYFALSAIASWLLVPRRNAIYATGGIVLLGIVLEVAQHFIGRDMSICDIIANALGAVAGSAFVWACCIRVCKNKNRAG